MKTRLDELTAILAEEKKLSKLNLILSLLVALLSGVVIGFLLCPRRQKATYFGCYNGSNNSNYNDNGGEDGCCEEDCCEGGLCCEECDEERCCGEFSYCGNEACCCEEFNDGFENQEDGEEESPKEYVKIK